MEAVPKLSFLSFELKISPENTHFGPKLKQYIAEAYREDPDSYGNEIHQLEGLRSAAVRPTIDAAGLKALNKYFCQLRAMQSRFPMAKGQPAACPFAWKDLYANMNCSLSDIRFEMACILYNIGALHTQLAASEARATADSLKAACQHFQNAAWAFQYLREQYPQPSGADVSSEILKLLQEICFAQAQECILDKSRQDTRKSSVIGAVATQVLHFYKNSLAILGPSTGTDNIHEIIGTKLYNTWYRNLSFKASYIGCIVALYQGINAEEQQKMGERVAYYQQAVDKLNEARKLAKYIEPVQATQEALTFTNDIVEGKRKAAKNENEFIYHEEVPEKDMLTELKPVCLVKAVAINFNDPEVSGQDIFSRLVPMGAHEASSLYSEEKAKLLRHVVSQVEAKNVELTEFMSSLQLDQLDVLDTEQKIPQEIVDRCAAMNAKTEMITTLVDSMNSLAEVISDVEHALAEIKADIEEERQLERQHAQALAAGARPPSLVQTELARELHKYGEAHARTADSNLVLHKAVALHLANLRLLAQPLDRLRAAVPSPHDIEGLDRSTMAEMRRVVGKAREMQQQRAALLAELRDELAADDVTAKLLADPTLSHEDLFRRQLDQHTPKVKIIEQNLSAQENIINRLTSLYAAYGDSRRLLADVLRRRDAMLSALITSYDSWGELVGKCRKGLEFYRKLQHNLGGLRTRLRAARHVQRDERHLADSAPSGPAAATPANPAATPANPPDTSDTAGPVLTSKVGPVPTGAAPKLKDYLPYMKNRTLARNMPPQAPVDLQPDSSYPDPIYPTSIRPNPVGSEATDLAQPHLPDGVTPNVAYMRYPPAYMSTENDPYAAAKYGYSAHKGLNKPEEINPQNYNYAAYSQPQFPTSMPEQQSYAHPYQAAPQSAPMPDAQNTTMYNPGQPNVPENPYAATYNPYMASQVSSAADMTSYHANQDLSANFSQMHVSTPKSDPMSNFSGEYSQTYFSVHYPPTSSNVATYSHAAQNNNTNSTTQLSTDYSMNYPYSAEGNQYGQNVPSQPTFAQEVPNSYPSYSQAQQNPSGHPSASTAAPNTYQPYQNVPNASNVYSPTSDFNSGNSFTNTSNTNTYASASVPNPNMSAPTSLPYQNINTSNSISNVSNPYSVNQQYAFTAGFDNLSQGYVYTNADTSGTSTTNASTTAFSTGQGYSLPTDSANYINPALSQIDAYDKPIKSHAKGEALSAPPISSYQSFNTNVPVNYIPEQTVPPTYNEQNNPGYGQTYQNHPGYTYNACTGNYDYSYGSQNSFNNYGQQTQQTIDPQAMNQNQQNWNAPGVYTSAGAYGTVQSPSEPPQQATLPPPNPDPGQQPRTYYSSPYGHQAAGQAGAQAGEGPAGSDGGADAAPPTYMQAGGARHTSVTYSSDEVSMSKENSVDPASHSQTIETSPPTQVEPTLTVRDPPEPEPKVEEAKEPTAFDLLSDIDFSVEQMPLTPEIKVPPVSEKAIVKSSAIRREEVVKPQPKEEVIERPPKRDIFSDPSLINQFTQEVKNLQKLTDYLTNTSPSVLEANLKSSQDLIDKEDKNRSIRIAMRHSRNGESDVDPYDDTKLALKSDPDAYVNASYYKQLTSWCMPLVIAECPDESEIEIFWKAMFEYDVSCIVCLQTEIEMQSASQRAYWPAGAGGGAVGGAGAGAALAAGGVRVALAGLRRAAHWAERELRLSAGAATRTLTHYQLTAFPDKVTCSPLVMLCDAVWRQSGAGAGAGGGGGAGRAVCVQSGEGAGRSALVALLLAAMCQLRAGHIQLCELAQRGAARVAAPAHAQPRLARSLLYYAQGVLCSGTTMFNGEAVSAPSGAAALPPAPGPAPGAGPGPAPAPAPPSGGARGKFNRESFEEMRQAPGLKSGDMKDPLNFLDPLWSLKKK